MKINKLFLLVSMSFIANLFCSYSLRQDIPNKALFDAIENANVNAVRVLLAEKRINPNIPYQGKSALIKAITLSDPNAKAIVELLLKHDANPDYIDDSGMTPLVAAKYVNKPDIVLLLLQYGARVTTDKTLREEKKPKITCPYEKGLKKLEKEFYMVPEEPKKEEEEWTVIESPKSAWETLKRWLY